MSDWMSEFDRPMAYDREGHPINLDTWGRLHSDFEYTVVAQHWVRGWKISTVWLGIDHAFGNGPPLIFETMLFGPGDDQREELDHYQWRYPTEAAAFAGHDQALALVCDQLHVPAQSALTAAEIAAPETVGDEEIEALLNAFKRKDET